MKIWKEKPGVISEGPVWICHYGCWLHTADTLLGLLWSIVTEFRSDRHLAG